MYDAKEWTMTTSNASAIGILERKVLRNNYGRLRIPETMNCARLKRLNELKYVKWADYDSMKDVGK